jgi:hypothetical protein
MTLRSVAIRVRFVALALCAGMLSMQAAGARDTLEIEQQRQLFQNVFEAVERGDWSVVEKLPAADSELLRRYVLWPDLRATYWRANIRQASDSELDAFMQRYGTLRPARELRYRRALNLASSGDLAGYQESARERSRNRPVAGWQKPGERMRPGLFLPR